MASNLIYANCDLSLDHIDPKTGKPCLELKFPAGQNNQVVIYLTCNLAEMIGGAAKGARLRWQDQHPNDRW